MTIDERLEALAQTVELLTQMHRDSERANAEKFAILAERTVQLMDTMSRLGRIIEIHEDRLDAHEDRLDDLEGNQ
jgi:hypothetical protein